MIEDEDATPSTRRTVLAVVALLTVLALAGVSGLSWLVSLASSTTAGIRADERLEAGEGSAEGYRFWGTSAGGVPVRWDPCTPIRWIINPDGMRPGLEADLHDAVSRITSATGLTFAYEGYTDEPPSRSRRPYQPERYGERWAPVLIAFDDDLLDGAHDLGLAQPTSVGGDGLRVFVTGQIVFATVGPSLTGFSDRSRAWGAALLHELGHLVGLQHVDDRASLMYPVTVPGPVRFSPGDLAGLRQLGSGGCLEVPEARELPLRPG